MSLFINSLAYLDQFQPLSTGSGMVIIAGMPKSGTTAIARLIGAATGQDVCSDPFYQLDQKKIIFRKSLYNSQLSLYDLWKRNRRIFSGKIVKDPNFPFLLSQLRTLFPDAQLVFIVRDPRDNIRSILNRLNLPGNPKVGNLSSIKGSSAWINLLTGRTPDVPGNNYIEILAWRWRRAAEAFLEYREYGIEIRYEDFNKNKSVAIFQLGKQLGYTEFQDIDHLVDIQYQPKGNTKIPIDGFFDKASLDAIDRIIEPTLKEFGYETHHENS